jgi:hypothetical protein
MDEILIEEKKYVSSKQAAKATGYAKDYIGQLCREGRVPARLVGRSWYVLESAIQDHRFGALEVETKPKVQDTVRGTVSALSHWDSPRYEPAKPEFLPYMSRKEDEEEDIVTEDSKNLHESWREWFDHIALAATPAEVPADEAESAVSVTQQEEQKEERVEAVTEEEKVPLHFMSPRPEREPLEEVVRVQPKAEHKKATRSDRRVLERSIQIAGTLFAMISVAVAVAGSGYFDNYMISNSQASAISGITFYNK